MIGFFIGLVLAFVFVNVLRHVVEVETKQREEFLNELKKEMGQEEEEDTYALVGSADRPRPKGKHCPLHNWSWDEVNKRNICTWCNKTPTQIFNENGGGM